MPTKVTPHIQTKILELAPKMSQVAIARLLDLEASTVSNYVRQDEKRIIELQNNLKAESAELDADIAFELSTLAQYSFDKEKVKLELLDEFAEATGIVLSTVNDSVNNKSEFLDFLRSKAFELC